MGYTNTVAGYYQAHRLEGDLLRPVCSCGWASTVTEPFVGSSHKEIGRALREHRATHAQRRFRRSGGAHP
jgi:hypothetical protein